MRCHARLITLEKSVREPFKLVFINNDGSKLPSGAEVSVNEKA